MSGTAVDPRTCPPGDRQARVVKRQHRRWVDCIFRRIRSWLKEKQAAARVRSLRRSLRTAWLLDELWEGCGVIGYDWRYLYVNEAAARHGKRLPKDLIGRLVTDVYPGIEETDVFRRLRECMSSRRRDTLEHEFVYPDGSTNWFKLRIQPVPSGLFVLSMDIAQRKQAECELAEARERLLYLLDNTFDMVAEIDVRGHIVSVSANIQSLLGYEPEEVYGRVFLQMVRDKDVHLAEEAFTQVLQGQSLMEWEVKLVDRNGVEVVTESNVVPVFKNGVVERVLCMSRDISRERQAEAGMRRAVAKLKQTRDGVILAMSDVVAARDPYTAAHQTNVVQLATAIAIEGGRTEDETECIRVAAALHDLGKLHIPGETLSKPGRLSDIEFEMIKQHPPCRLRDTAEYQLPVARS